jgi:hypothetical protein
MACTSISLATNETFCFLFKKQESSRFLATFYKQNKDDADVMGSSADIVFDIVLLQMA